MGLAADCARLWEMESFPRLKERYAERYRRTVGIHPAHREELAAALEGIRAGGARKVSELIESLNRRVPRPSFPEGTGA